MCWFFFIFLLININLLFLLKKIFSIGIIVSKNLGISAPVIISTASYLFTFFNEGLSPADIVFKILKFCELFLFNLFVSFELIAKPSNAALVPAG